MCPEHDMACVAVCCSVYGACCSVLQYAWRVLQCVAERMVRVVVRCSVHGACCIVMQCDMAVRHDTACDAVCCSVPHYVAVCYTRHGAYGVATVSRIDKITGLFLQNIVSFIGLFCKRDL